MMRFVTRCGAGLAVLFFALFTTLTESQAAQYALLHGFAGAPNDGANPRFGSLATDGTSLYGLTFNGGVSNKGVLFKISPDGTGYQILHSFAGLSFADVLLTGTTGATNEAANPCGTPLLAGPTIYGMTLNGGTNGTGAIFSMNTDGSGFSVLHSFGGGFVGPWDGYAPFGSLVTDGTTLYGMTYTSMSSFGTIFSVGVNGSGYKTLHYFYGTTTDGSRPEGSLAISAGKLYGMTQAGGASASGTIFAMNTDGSSFQVLHSFNPTNNDGAAPIGSLIISNATLYGMTTAGGTNGVGTVFREQTDGSGYQILHSFAIATGWAPMGDLVLSNATLYGMTGGTNASGLGTIFQVNTDGSGFQVLHTFSYDPSANPADGSTPYGTLLWVGSELYGMTQAGDSSRNEGGIFSLASISTVGGLTVDIAPVGAISAGGQWQVDGGSFLNSGQIVTNLVAGPHTISFKSVNGWIAPADEEIQLDLGATNSVAGNYVQADLTAPTLSIVTPTPKLQVTESAFMASGSASDNVSVAGVYYQLNGGAWTPATTANNWANWATANLTLTPGTNVMAFYAADSSGNVSATNVVSFVFVVDPALTVNISPAGAGTIKPSLNGQLLPIGEPFSMTAKPAKGFQFVNWTGSATTTSTKLSFLMASNLTFTANFKDIARPVNAILGPKKNQNVTNAVAVAFGKAKDNAGVTAVWYQVNGGAWLPANLPDGTNWTTPDLSSNLLSGPNTLAAFAVDAAGNASLTNTIAFKHTIAETADWAPDSLNGLLAAVAPANGSAEAVSFDVSTFAQVSLANSTNWQDYGAGSYTYLKIDTNLAQLSLAFTAPPATSNSVGPVDLVFTNHYAAYFSNESGGDVGAFELNVATNLMPTTVVRKTLTTASSDDSVAKIKLATATTFTKTPANNSTTGTSSGTYTFTRFSPVCGMFTFVFTDAADAGQIAYAQTTFTTASSGSYFVTTFDGLGNLQDLQEGQFTFK